MTSVDNLQMQLQSARKSLLFMETQHASTLKGLHKEIQHLQKKCSELTFDLAMKSADNPLEGKVEQDKVSHLETEVADLLHEKISLMQEIEMRDRQLVELEEHAKEQERKYLNEIKTKKHKIAAVFNELDARATTIAYLSTQLHQANSKLNKIQKHDVNTFAPNPPAQPRPPSARRLHPKSKSVDVSIRPASTESQIGYQFVGKSKACLHRPSSSSSAEQPQRLEQKLKAFKPRFVPSPMPDPAPFLNAGEKPADESPQVRPTVLPPIGSSLDSLVKDDNGNKLQNNHGAVPYPANPVAERLAFNRAITANRKAHRNEVSDY